ncbi:MAG: DNA polymerase III subunit delta [Nitrospirae bacterium]|nr:DNA polymerase III subunit delta [Nitrospirota bacterium]
MLNKGLEKELKKHLPQPIYFVWSAENFFLDDFLSKAVDMVLAGHLKDFNFNVFYPETVPNEIIDSALTLPFMAPRRLVVVRDFHQFQKSFIKALEPYLKQPSQSTCMLILSQVKPKTRKDQKNLFDDVPVFPLIIKEADVPAWIKQRAHEKGINMTQGAVDYLIEFLGHDIGLLAAELEKFSASGLKLIGGKDILSLTGMMREYTVFNLVDAVMANNKANAFRILKVLFENGFEATSILGALNWHYRQFYNLWEGKGKRVLKMGEITYRTLLKHLPSCTEKYFSGIFQCMHEADAGIKTSTGRPEVIMELLLLKLLQPHSMN